MTALPEGELSAGVLVPLVLILLLRGALGGLFLGAGVAKLLRPGRFFRVVRRYGLVPSRVVRSAAFAVIAVEVTLGAALLVGIEVAVFLFLTGVALISFAAAVGTNLIRGRSFDCGCSILERESPISWSHVLRNTALGSLAIAAASLEPGVEPPLVPALAVLAFGFAAPALVTAERRLTQLTPYPVGPTLRHFADLHPELLQQGRIGSGEA